MFFLFILVSSHSLAQEVNFEDVKQWSGCVKFADENRLYLNGEDIYPSDSGLFLVINNEGDFVRLTSLFSDHHGCYVNAPHAAFSGEKNVEVRNKCPSCGERYIVRCTNKDCPSYKKRKEKERSK